MSMLHILVTSTCPISSFCSSPFLAVKQQFPPFQFILAVWERELMCIGPHGIHVLHAHVICIT